MAITGPSAPTPPTAPTRPTVDGADNNINTVTEVDGVPQNQNNDGINSFGVHITVGNLDSGQSNQSNNTGTAQNGNQGINQINSQNGQVDQSKTETPKNIGSSEKNVVEKNQQQGISDAAAILQQDGDKAIDNQSAQQQSVQENSWLPFAHNSSQVGFWPFAIVFVAAFITFFILNFTKKKQGALTVDDFDELPPKPSIPVPKTKVKEAYQALDDDVASTLAAARSVIASRTNNTATTGKPDSLDGVGGINSVSNNNYDKMSKDVSRKKISPNSEAIEDGSVNSKEKKTKGSRFEIRV